MILQQLDVYGQISKQTNKQTNPKKTTQIQTLQNHKKITHMDSYIYINTEKLLQENIGENLCNLGFGNEYLVTIPKAGAI